MYELPCGRQRRGRTGQGGLGTVRAMRPELVYEPLCLGKQSEDMVGLPSKSPSCLSLKAQAKHMKLIGGKKLDSSGKAELLQLYVKNKMSVWPGFKIEGRPSGSAAINDRRYGFTPTNKMLQTSGRASTHENRYVGWKQLYYRLTSSHELVVSWKGRARRWTCWQNSYRHLEHLPGLWEAVPRG